MSEERQFIDGKWITEAEATEADRAVGTCGRARSTGQPCPDHPVSTTADPYSPHDVVSVALSGRELRLLEYALQKLWGAPEIIDRMVQEWGVSPERVKHIHSRLGSRLRRANAGQGYYQNHPISNGGNP